VQSLLEQIEAEAAKRLTLPLLAQPGEERARCRQYLRVLTHLLKMRHRAGASGLAICHARARVLDLLLCHIVNGLVQAAPLAPRQASPRWALAATGGYGRAELNPFSDLDVMFLHDRSRISRVNPPPFLEAITGGLIFDVGLKVGFAVRNLDDCVELANRDMQSKTALIEARLICGDEALFDKLQQVLLARCVAGHQTEYITARLVDQAARRARFGNSVCLQEPHVKNGCGGLRDYQNLLWMAFFKHRSRTLAELEQRQLLGEAERRRLEAGYEFLLRTRNELHYQLNRPVDVLTKTVQPAVAYNLGYTDRSPSRRLERFMRAYYLHARDIYLITRTLEQRLALAPAPSRPAGWRNWFRSAAPPVAELDGFKFVDGQIQGGSPRVFQEEPRRLMRVFRHAQQRGLTLHPELAALIRNQLGLARAAFGRDERVHETFLELLNQRGNVAPMVRAMHEAGLLGRYLPPFGKLTALVQHEFYHRYTADEHTLVCLENLDRLWGAKDPLLAPYGALFQKVERPCLLYLALLLHDAGKASHLRDHVHHSTRIALGVAKRLGLDVAATHTLALLVGHHLAMAHTSQRRDLDDPGEIRRFATNVESQENLDLLTLLTFADATATSDQLWNGFKDTLLWTLYRRAWAVLTGGGEFAQAEARQREQLAAAVRRLAPAAFGDDELQGHFAKLPARYFRLRTAKEVLTDLTLAHHFMRRQLAQDEDPLAPLLDWHHEPDRGYSQVRVCTWDRLGLFSTVAGALTAAGLNILSAEIFTREDSIVLDTFVVTDALTGTLANREEQERFEGLLKDALTSRLDLSALIRRRQPSQPPPQPPGGERLPTAVRFNNESSDTRTVIEVETEDRVGLLHAISQALSAMRLDISLAKICTEMGVASDTFYVSELSRGKVLDPGRWRAIEACLRAAIAKLG
jgi:[protein-PII] uridylyltransferase